MVDRGCERRRDARLFPRRSNGRHASLALSRRHLRTRDRTAALVPARFPGMSEEGFAEWAATSYFSFLRGASSPEELVREAKALGLAGLGLADRNSMAGLVRAHSVAREEGLR